MVLQYLCLTCRTGGPQDFIDTGAPLWWGVGRIQAWALIVWKRHSVPVGNYSFVANSSKCCSSFLCILSSFYFKWNRTGRTTPERIFVLQRELGVKSVGHNSE